MEGWNRRPPAFLPARLAYGLRNSGKVSVCSSFQDPQGTHRNPGKVFCQEGLTFYAWRCSSISRWS